jgi:hypothetical protein
VAVLEEHPGVWRWYVMRRVGRGRWEGRERSRRPYASESAAAAAGRAAWPEFDFHGDVTQWVEDARADALP